MSRLHTISITTQTPFNYGHLITQGGVSTIPDVISDRAVSFALCAALGMMSRSLVPPEKDYKGHMAVMPWRCSVFDAQNPSLLAPIARRSDLGVEGGYPSDVRRASGSGNFKEYFTIQEVPSGVTFTGILVGADPFEVAESDAFAIRIGSNRTGIALVERAEVETVSLNAATAKLFGRELRVRHGLLDQIQLTERMKVDQAAQELALWQ